MSIVTRGRRDSQRSYFVFHGSIRLKTISTAASRLRWDSRSHSSWGTSAILTNSVTDFHSAGVEGNSAVGISFRIDVGRGNRKNPWRR